MAIEGALALEQLPDGVYLRLPEAKYFAQDRLGSSDLIKLHKHKEGWWWQSRWNPDRTNAQTKAQAYGSALHALLLEGLHAYETRYAVAPDSRDYPRLLTTIGQIKEALAEDAGLDLKGTSKNQLGDWLDLAAIHLPDRPCWEAIKRDFERSCEITDEFGEVIGVKPSISAAEDRMLRFMYVEALEDQDVRGLLGYGEDFPTLAEVSVFWTDSLGVRRRARFDKPVPKFTLDLKSLGNWEGRELTFALGDRIKREGYHIQRADQHVARRQMHRMIAESASLLHGGSDEEREWITAIATRDLPFDFVWLFYQKPEESGRAPIIFPVWDDKKSRFHVDGHRKAVKAVRFYAECVERFGLGDRPAADGREARPWARVEPVHYTDEDLDPHITVPHFDWDEESVEGEDEAMA